MLAYLALRCGQPCPRDTLAALLWGDLPEDQARHSLRQTLLEVRHALPDGKPPTVVVERDRIGLNPRRVQVDVGAFERFAAQRTRGALERAAGLYRGELLAGMTLREPAFEEWLRAERNRFREAALGVFQRLLAAQSARRQLESAVQTAIRLLAIDPLQEPVHRTLMRLYDRLGRRPAALRQYHLCADLLRRELGIAPEPETTRLWEALAPRPLVGAHPRRAPRSRARREPPPREGGDIPLVGRHAELERLRAAAEDAVGGRGRLVVIAGGAGIGKSRLLQEFETESRAFGLQPLLGRCYDLTRVLAFGPWVEAIRGASIVEDRDLVDRLGLTDRVEISRLLPELGPPGVQPPERPEDHLRLFEAMAHLLEGLASRRPLLLMLEDLHWADEMSARLLFYLGRRLKASRVLLTVTVRDDELAEGSVARRMLEDVEREWPGARIGLSPLSKLEAGVLVRAAAKTDASSATLDHLADQVWELSRGNPFMIVETMRALPDEPAESGMRLSLPGRVRDLIAGRLSRLSDRVRQIVAVAAVAGRDFDFDLVQRAAGLGESEAADALEQLVRRQILCQVGDRFDFVHERLREVAHGELIPPRRRALHRAVGEALEALESGDLEAHFSTLATHYRHAEVWDKAVSYLRRAGDQAAGRSALREAVTFIEGALEALRHLPDGAESQKLYIDLVLELYAARLPLGLPEGSLDDLRRAQSLAESLHDQARLARVDARLARSLYAAGQAERAPEYARRSVALGLAAGDRTGPVLARIVLGEILSLEGDDEQVIAICRENIEALSGDPITRYFGLAGLPSVFSRMHLGWSLVRRGEFAAALRYAHEAMSIAESGDRPLSLSAACQILGGAYLAKGDLDKAFPQLERGLDLNRTRIGFHRAEFASLLGRAYVLAGRVDRAIPLLEGALEHPFGRGSPWEALRLLPLASGYAAAGRLEDARRATERALERAQPYKLRPVEPRALHILALIALRCEPPDSSEALSRGQQALALSTALGMRPLVAHCHLVIGRACRGVGQWAEAEAHLIAAERLLREMDMTHWLPAIAEARGARSGHV